MWKNPLPRGGGHRNRHGPVRRHVPCSRRTSSQPIIYRKLAARQRRNWAIWALQVNWSDSLQRTLSLAPCAPSAYGPRASSADRGAGGTACFTSTSRRDRGGGALPLPRVVGSRSREVPRMDAAAAKRDGRSCWTSPTRSREVEKPARPALGGSGFGSLGSRKRFPDTANMFLFLPDPSGLLTAMCAGEAAPPAGVAGKLTSLRVTTGSIGAGLDHCEVRAHLAPVLSRSLPARARRWHVPQV